MKFHPVSQEIAESDVLAEEYAVARQIGTVRVGRSVLFFRAGLKTYYIPYDAVHRCFRRVYQVPIKMCCGRGEVDYEHLIISDGEKEVADIPLPVRCVEAVPPQPQAGSAYNGLPTDGRNGV